jgi:hypothetical protein
MSNTKKNMTTADEAKKFANDQEALFRKQANRMRLLNNLFQILTVLAGGITALAASLDWPKWAVVIPAVLTSISSSFIMTFRYRDKFVIFTIASERLKLKQLRFEAKSASPIDDALMRFLDELEIIMNGTRSEWREVNLSGRMPTATEQQLQPYRNPDDENKT